MTTLVWHDGDVVEHSTPIMTATDHGVLMGDGVFETLAVRDGRPRLLERHLRRLRAGMERLAIVDGPDEGMIRTAIDELMEASGLTEARVRVTVTAGPGSSPRERAGTPTTFVTIAPLGPIPSSVSLHLVPWPRNERSALAGIKSINWAENAHALRAATDAGHDNALFLDTRGRLSECATANVFLVLDGRIATPSLASGCLAGTVRAVLLDAAVAIEADLGTTELERATGAFITTSTTGVTPVRAVDGLVLPTDLDEFDLARSALDAAD